MDKILLVDYKAETWEYELRKALSPQYELVSEKEGINAIDRIRAEQPSLVLLSQSFPRQREKDGILILRGIKRTEIGAGLKTIMLLDKQSHRLEQECRLAGANYCFVRGNSLDELKTQIEYALAVPKARILFIDDEWEKMNWDILLSDNLGTGKLGPGGFEVSCVASDTEAYKKLDEEKIDLVILDLKFEEQGETYGIEILKEIKRRKPPLEVIMLSGLEVDPDIVLKCAEAGAPHYIKKQDIDWNKFADLINRALAESEHAREFHARIDRLEDEPQSYLPRKLRRQEIDELRRAVNSIASKDYSRPIHYFEAAMELFLKAQYDGNEQKQLPGLKEVVKNDFADRFGSFSILIPVDPNLIYLDKLRELRNCASHPPFPAFTIDDAIITARIALRTVEGLLNGRNYAKIDYDLEELSAKLESLPDGTLKQRLELALIFIDNRAECCQQIHESVNEIIRELYPQIIENPVWDTSAARIKSIAGEIKKVIIPWSQEENSLYLSADWEEFVNDQHLIRCYLDWTSELYPHLTHLQQEDLIVCLRVAIRLAEWFLEDYQKSDLFKKVRDGRKSKFYVTRRFPPMS